MDTTNIRHLHDTLEEVKAKTAAYALVESGANQSDAADLLDISRGTLRTLLKAYIGKGPNDKVDGKLTGLVYSKYLNLDKKGGHNSRSY